MLFNVISITIYGSMLLVISIVFEIISKSNHTFCCQMSIFQFVPVISIINGFQQVCNEYPEKVTLLFGRWQKGKWRWRWDWNTWAIDSRAHKHTHSFVCDVQFTHFTRSFYHFFRCNIYSESVHISLLGCCLHTQLIAVSHLRRLVYALKWHWSTNGCILLSRFPFKHPDWWLSPSLWLICSFIHSFRTFIIVSSNVFSLVKPLIDSNRFINRFFPFFQYF